MKQKFMNLAKAGFCLGFLGMLFLPLMGVMIFGVLNIMMPEATASAIAGVLTQVIGWGSIAAFVLSSPFIVWEEMTKKRKARSSS